MSRTSGVLAAMKAVPGGARHTPAPQSGGMGAINQVAANAMWGSSYQNTYGPFLPRPSMTFTDGAFGPMSPIQPVPVDQPAVPGGFPDPRLWQYPVGYNLPTQPGTEGFKLASFQTLQTIAEKYSVARRCIQLRKEEIQGLDWSIEMTTQAAMAYQGDHKAMRDFGERAAKATKFFQHPDPDYWNFKSWLGALLEEIFVFDALCLVFRPKYGKGLGRGLLGSDLDSLSLVSGPTVRPLLNMHGGKPRPPAPAYQQFLYGVPRSDYQTIITGSDIDDYGLAGSEINSFRADTMLYAPLVTRRESPYGFPPVEQALLPIMSGLQKQEYQLGWYQEGTVPACYISPGDPNMTPTQVRELQEALNGIAGDPMYHLKVIVLPPGSKVEPQRPVDLADTFDTLVQTQVCMQLDVMPDELGLLPNVGGAGAGGASNASALRFASSESRDPKGRKSTKPLLMTLCDIANYVLQDICGQPDMQFAFEGLQAEDDKQALVDRGVQGIQNGLYSIDEVRGWLDLPPWGLQETSEPVVFTAQGPIPFSMAPELIRSAITGDASASGQGTNSGQRSPSSRSRTKHPTVRAGGQTKPNGSHEAPIAPHREAPATPAHAAAAGAIQSPTPRTGGTTSRSSVAGSRKKAVASELDALKRHLRKGRDVSTWEPRHLPGVVMATISEDLAKGILIDVAVESAGDMCLKADLDDGPVASGLFPPDPYPERRSPDYCWKSWPPRHTDECDCIAKSAPHWPGWERDLGLVGRYKQAISQAFHDAEARGSDLRKKAATGAMFVSNGTLRDLIGDEVREVFTEALTPLWTHAWNLGYASAKSLVTGQPADFAAKHEGDHLTGFLGTEGEHWLSQIARTGLGNNSTRSELIARTEVARAVNSAAIQCYRDHGVTHKHLLASPGACETCEDVADDGDIALDAPFAAGGVLGLLHPACRCCPAPSGVMAEPPLADLGKSAAAEDESRLAWLLLRARDEDGKWRFLLQQRPDGTWGMPGGKPHVGEDSWAAALRETTEEIGEFPPPRIVGTFHHVEDDGQTQVFLWLCDVPYFHPTLGGSTPEETLGAAWFRRKEIAGLDLAPKFREDWEKGICLREHVTKSMSRRVNENGEVTELTEASQALQAVGSRWPYPHRSDGAEWPDSGPGNAAGAMGASEPPHWDDDHAEVEPHDTLEPAGDDGEMPSHGRKPNPPADAFPDQGSEHDDAWPYPQTTLTPGMTTVGTPKSQGDGHPVVGSVPAKTPKPMSPHAVEPQVYDPAEAVEDWSPAAGSDVVHDLPKGAGGPSDYRDASPVDPEHVANLMRANFPESALDWVKRSAWTGPQLVPWDRIDHDDEAKWAAAHEPAKVRQFVRDIKAGRKTNPSILFQPPGDGKVIVSDGHHRAVARHSMGQDVLAYVGHIRAQDREAAEQTHSFQFHAGSDPQNKSAQTPVVSTVHHPLGTEGLWHTPDRHVSAAQQLPAYIQNTARALMRDHDMEESQAIATAINAVKEWAAGRAFGGHVKVTDEVRQAAQRALQEWEDLKRTHHP